MSVHCGNTSDQQTVDEYTYLPGSSKYIEMGRPVDSANTNKPWRRNDRNSLGKALNDEINARNLYLQKKRSTTA